MPISQTPTSPTQSGGMPSMTLPGAQPNLFAGLSSPTFNFQQIPGGMGANPQSIQTLLSQPQTSLTNSIMPYLAQLYGTSAGLTQNLFQQQGAQGAGQAQSDAMKRGLTGSSIEASGIQGAYQGANQGFNQYLAQLMPQLGGQFTGAQQFDIGQQNTQFQNLAQMLGQQYASEIQQRQFQQQLQAMMDQASMTSNAQMWSGIAGGLGSAIGGIGGGMMMA